MALVNGMLIFDVMGAMAHFRKFYTNSSSLSYPFPPRTTLAGIIGAILGFERDSYHELLGPKHARLAVSVRTPTRSFMQTVNPVLAKSLRDINGSAGHTQVPTELVVSSVVGQPLRYRIYFWHDDTAVMDELERRIRHCSPAYPPALGTASMLASMQWVKRLQAEHIQLVGAQEVVTVVTPWPAEKLVWLSPPRRNRTGELQIVQELMPYTFEKGRTNGKTLRYLFEKQGRPVPVRLNIPVYIVHYVDSQEEHEIEEAICFAEESDH